MFLVLKNPSDGETLRIFPCVFFPLAKKENENLAATVTDLITDIDLR